MSVKTKLQFNVTRVREEAEMLFSTDRPDRLVNLWSKKSRVSQPTLRAFLKGKTVKFATAVKIVAPTGLDLNELVTLNGKKLA